MLPDFLYGLEQLISKGENKKHVKRALYNLGKTNKEQIIDLNGFERIILTKLN